MKLLSFRSPDGTPTWGVAKGEGVIDLSHLAPGILRLWEVDHEDSG